MDLSNAKMKIVTTPRKPEAPKPLAPKTVRLPADAMAAIRPTYKDAPAMPRMAVVPVTRAAALAKSTPVTQAPVMPSSPVTMVIQHITHEQVMKQALPTVQQVAGSLLGAATPRWKAAQTLAGAREKDALLQSVEVLLGRVLVSLHKLEAASREGRGAVISEAEFDDWLKAEELVGKIG